MAIHFAQLTTHEFFPLRLHSPVYGFANITPAWRPPQRHLHYDELYRGIYEWLRNPPDNRWRTSALYYLEGIRRNLHVSPRLRILQQHRIQWITEWIRALPDDADEVSDAETEKAWEA